MIERHNQTLPLEQSCKNCEANRAAGASFCGECGRDLRPAASAQIIAGPGGAAPAETTPADRVDAVAQVQASGPRRSDPAEAGVPLAPSVQQTQPPLAEPPQTGIAPCCPTCGAATPQEQSEPGYCITRVGTGGEKAPLPANGECVIGTDEECDVSIAGDSYLSRRHARVRNDGGLIFVDDLGSSNGTLLRIRRPIVIEPGDEILVGTSVLRLDQHG